MPIVFSCRGCGKTFTAPDALAGKKVACKACDHKMVVPAESAHRDERQEAPATVVQPVSETYDIEEADAATSTSAPLPAELTPDRTKKGSSFRRKKTSSRDKGRRGIGWRDPVPLVTPGFVVFLIVFFGFRGCGPLTASDFHQQTLKLEQELLVCAQTVRDVPSAKQSSPKMNDILDRIIKLLNDHKAAKNRERDVWAVEARFQRPHQELEMRLLERFRLITEIPGAYEALQIDRKMDRIPELKSP